MDKDQAPGSSSSTGAVTHWSWRGENPPVVRNESSEDLGNIAAEVAKIYNADRQDSLQALQARRQNRTVAATSEFISLEDLLRTQAEPAPGQEIVDMILRDFCSSPTYVEEEDLPACETLPWFRFRKKKIRTYARKRAPAQQNAIEVDDEEEDDRLSCSSGLSVQEDHTAPTATSVCELDANTSQKICENLLNLSQYFSLSNPSSSSNPSKDQPAAVTIEIDLPTKVRPEPPKQSDSRDRRSNLSDTNSSAECTAIELENLESDLLGIGFTFEASEVCDIKPQVPENLRDTLFGDGKTVTTIVQSQSDSKVCADWSEGDSLLENYNTEKMCLSDGELEEKPQAKSKLIEVKSEVAEECTQSLLDGIPISEWQTPMDIPEESIKETADLGQIEVKVESSQNETQETVKASTSKCISDADFLQEIPLDEWQPMEIPEFVGFRTASDKPIVISEEMQKRAAKLLADIGEIEPKPQSDRPAEPSDFVGFRTASNKPIEITEEMASKGAMFIAQFKAIDQSSEEMQERAAKLLADIGEIEPKPPNDSATEPSDFVGFRTASNKPIEITEEMQERAAKLLADIGEMEPKPENDRPTESSEFVGFRTASDKPIEISKEMQERAAKLLADIGEIEPQLSSDRPREPSDFVGFRTASNKPIEITEEMASKGAMFIAQFKASDQLSQSNDAKFLEGIAFSEWQPIDFPEKLTVAPAEEELIQSNNRNNLQTPKTKTPNKSQSLNIPQLVAFRKTPYKFMEVAEEMKIKGDKLMAEVESGLYEPSQRRNSQNPEVLPDKKLQRSSAVSEELKTKTAQVKEVADTQSEFVGFRTASNKQIVVSEEMKIKAAQFMAEFQTEVSNQEHEGDANENNTNFIDQPIVFSEEMKRSVDKLIGEAEASCSNYQKEEAAGSAKIEADFVGFRTASNKAIVISEAMKAKAAIFMAEFQAESNENNENKASNSDDASEVFGFQTASKKRMEISEETNNKAAQVIAEVQTGNEVKKNQETSDNECLSDISDNASGEEFKGFPEIGLLPLSDEEDLPNDSVFPRLSQTTKNLPDCKDDSRVSTPKQRRDTSDGIPSSSRRLRKISNSSPDQNRQQASRKVHKTISCHSGLGTPIQSQEIHASLTQLAGLSPLDQKTKTSVIARRNLLTLSKRRKRSRTPTGTLEGNIITPIKSRLAALPASTSTPLADRNTNQVQDATATKQSAEDMSPICMPPNKSRRLGLSRSRY